MPQHHQPADGRLHGRDRVNTRIVGISLAAALGGFLFAFDTAVIGAAGLTFAYGFYAFFAILSFFFVWWKVPETKGIELEDMSEDLSAHPRS